MTENKEMSSGSITESELENSLIILQQTINNLTEKHDFLKEQYSLYVDLEEKLPLYVKQENIKDTHDQKEKIIGEIVIKGDKFFKNIGYEYYKQVSFDECMVFVEFKKKMIGKAIEQFEQKLKECNDVLKDFEKFNMLQNNEDDEGNEEGVDKDSEYPVMEIREELDENGNVISSDIKPLQKESIQSRDTTIQSSTQKNNNTSSLSSIMEIREELDKDGNVVVSNVYSHDETLNNDLKNSNNNNNNNDDDKNNLKDLKENEEFYDLLEDMGIIDNRKEYIDAKHHNTVDNEETIQEKDIPQIEEVQENNDEQYIKEVDIEDINILGKASSNKEYLKYTDPNKPAIDPNDIYTLEEIIQKIDLNDLDSEQDFDDDGQEGLQHGADHLIDEFDYEKFDKYFNDDYSEEQSDDDDDEIDDDNIASLLVPNQAASLAFTNSILQLRQQKTKLNEKDGSSPKVSQAEEVLPPIVLKSILKSKIKPMIGAAKKSVVFANNLDIKIIENLKEETRKNTFGYLAYYDTEDRDDDYESYYDLNKVNAQTQDQNINDEYKYGENTTDVQEVRTDELTEGSNNEKLDDPAKKEPKISKFKQNRLNKNKSKRNSLLLENFDINTGFQNDEYIENSILDDVLKDIMTETSTREDSSIQGVVENDVHMGVTSDIVERNFDAVSPYVPIPEYTNTKKKSLFSKSFNSLQKPRTPVKKEIELDFSNNEDDEQSDNSDSDLETPLELNSVARNDSVENKQFPTAIKNIIEKDEELEIITNPGIDYAQLTDIDDMAQAYAMGLYDDDIMKPSITESQNEENALSHDGPGYVIEKIEDFEGHNKTVESLKDEIDEFLIQRNNNDEVDEDENNQLFNDTSALDGGMIMGDIVERDNQYEGVINDDDEDNYAFQDHTLQEEISKSYYSMRQHIIANQRSSTTEDEKGKEYEPIDEYGNPVKTSKFKSSRINIKSTKF